MESAYSQIKFHINETVTDVDCLGAKKISYSTIKGENGRFLYERGKEI